MKENTKRSFLLSGVFIIIFIVATIFMATFMFIFKISIHKIYVFISLLISIIVTIFLLKKNKILNVKSIIISVIMPILLIILSIILNGHVIDNSHDGNMYHKSTIGLLKNGWNPLYENVEDFDSNEENPLYIENTGNQLWINHYARGSHIFQACIYKLTDNIESGKAINTLSIASLFLLVSAYLSLKLKKQIFPILFAIVTVTPSVVCAQFLTNYIDFLVYIYLTILLLSFFILEYKENQNEETIGLLIYFLSLLMLINIKFTSFAYAGLYCLCYYIYYIVKLKKQKLDRKYFIKFSITSAVAVIIGVFIIGLAVYPKNYLNDGHPFYPLFGKNKVDIITDNQPDYFENKSTLEKFVISTLSRVDNISKYDKQKAEYKIPFTFNEKELHELKNVDTRISGHGVIFGGIFITSLIILIILSFKIYKNDRQFFYMCSITIFLTVLLIFGLSESWWARYLPQVYYIPLVSILYLNKIKLSQNKLLLPALLSIVLLVNNAYTLKSVVKNSYDFTFWSNNQYRLIKENIDCDKYDIYISSPVLPGAMYNVFDNLKEYEIITEKKTLEEVADYNYLMCGLVFERSEKK